MLSRRRLAAIVLGVCIAAPLLELFDGWDPADAGGSDTELVELIAATCVGVAIVAAGVEILIAPPMMGAAAGLPASSISPSIPAAEHRLLRSRGSPFAVLRV